MAWFPEPSERDDTWGTEEEQPVEWLRRSTLPRAVSIRQALNENLGHFERPIARKLAKKLRENWKSHFFELLVGRWLQEVGADVDYEPQGSNGTRIDWRASFPEGAIYVEAVAKLINQGAVPGVAYMDDSGLRIRQAFVDRNKRRQAEGAGTPAILAIDGGTFGARLDDFDQQLLGSSVQHVDLRGKTVGYSFHGNGAMTVDPGSPWAGVLAFVEPSVFRAPEPVLFVSPHYHGPWPVALIGVARRMLGTQGFPRSDDSPMSRIVFAASRRESSE